jgi:hypothetical protein
VITKLYGNILEIHTPAVERKEKKKDKYNKEKKKK